MHLCVPAGADLAGRTYNEGLQKGVQELSSVFVWEVAARQLLLCCSISALVSQLVCNLWRVVPLLVPLHRRKVSARVTDALQGHASVNKLGVAPPLRAISGAHECGIYQWYENMVVCSSSPSPQ